MDNLKENKSNSIMIFAVVVLLSVSNILLANYLDISKTISLFVPNGLFLSVTNGTLYEYVYIVLSAVFGIQYFIFLIFYSFIGQLIASKTKNKLMEIVFFSFSCIIAILFLSILIFNVFIKENMKFLDVNNYFTGIHFIGIGVFVLAMFICLINKKLNLSQIVKITIMTLILYIFFIMQIYAAIASVSNHVVETTKSFFKTGTEYNIVKVTPFGINVKTKTATTEDITGNYTNVLAISNQIYVNKMDDKEIVNAFERFYENSNYEKETFADKYMKSTISTYMVSKLFYTKCKEYDLKIIDMYKKDGLENVIKHIEEEGLKCMLSEKLLTYSESLNLKE